MFTKVKTDKEIEDMRSSGKILSQVLDVVEAMVEPGVSGVDIDRAAKKELKALGAEAPFLGYQGFPAAICVSINDVVEHGIPKPQPFEDGDIVSLDLGAQYNGMITDSGRSIVAGKATKEVEQLLETTKRSLMAGIDAVKDGVKVGQISAAIQKVLDSKGYGIVQDLVGHGVGHQLHEDPNIPNYGSANEGPILKKGMTIAIEPMATLGGYKLKVDPDGWTIRTVDGSLAVHFEHTILITDKGAEILT